MQSTTTLRELIEQLQALEAVHGGAIEVICPGDNGWEPFGFNRVHGARLRHVVPNHCPAFLERYRDDDHRAVARIEIY